jgi:hypothetical protein
MRSHWLAGSRGSDGLQKSLFDGWEPLEFSVASIQVLAGAIEIKLEPDGSQPRAGMAAI